METRKLIASIKLSGLLFLLFSCSKDPVFDFFIGAQPQFVGEHKFVPGLNIFGIIRPDSFKSAAMTFVHVEKAIPAISDKDVTFSVDNVQVVFYKIVNKVATDSLFLGYNNPHDIFSHLEFRPDNFNPIPGECYRIKCSAKDLPVLTAETTVPSVPQIEGDSVFVKGNKVHFAILKDSTAAMYDANITISGSQFLQRIVPEQTGNTNVEIEFSGDINSGAVLNIYAYDKNLSEYFAAANLSFKPNTFRPPFTNVENGYGCFGSMNLLVKNLK